MKLFGASFYIFDPQGNVAMFSSQKAFKLKGDMRLGIAAAVLLCAIEGRQG